MQTLDEKIKKNIKGLKWWAKYYSSANDFFGEKVGHTMNVSIFDVMPNLRNEEFEIKNNAHSATGSEISVYVNKEGVLVISNGHHRFNDAITSGKIRVDVFIEEINVGSIYTGENLFKSLSNEMKDNLKNND